jgi:hypothetical protein
MAAVTRFEKFTRGCLRPAILEVMVLQTPAACRIQLHGWR